MNVRSMILIVQLVAEGVGVAKEIAALAKRVKKGDIIKDSDIEKARGEIDVAVTSWNDSVKKKSKKKVKSDGTN